MALPVRNVDDVEAAVRANVRDEPVVLEFLRPSGTESSFTLDLRARLPAEGMGIVAFTPDAGPRLSQSR